MSIHYPQEIIEQQAKVRKELEKLAKMRTDYLKSTGQMPPSSATSKSATTDVKLVESSQTSGNTSVS